MFVKAQIGRERSRRGRNVKHKLVRYDTLEILDEDGRDQSWPPLHGWPRDVYWLAIASLLLQPARPCV